MRVQAALALTEMIVVYDSGAFMFLIYLIDWITDALLCLSHTVKAAVAPQVGKVIQDLLKLSDDTDLDILNRSMEVMVEEYQTELLPVAAQLTARLVSLSKLPCLTLVGY